MNRGEKEIRKWGNRSSSQCKNRGWRRRRRRRWYCKGLEWFQWKLGHLYSDFSHSLTSPPKTNPPFFWYEILIFISLSHINHQTHPLDPKSRPGFYGRLCQIIHMFFLLSFTAISSIFVLVIINSLPKKLILLRNFCSKIYKMNNNLNT